MSRAYKSSRPGPSWPEPVWDPQTPADAIQNLRHTLAVFGDRGPSPTLMVMAPSNIYGPLIRTGLTWRDLELLAEAVDELP